MTEAKSNYPTESEVAVYPTSDSMLSGLAHSKEWLGLKAAEFTANSIVRVSELFVEEFYAGLEQEAEMLASRYGVRRNFRMRATGCSPRQMTNVAQSVIEEHSPLAMSIYHNPLLRRSISSIVSAPIFDCPYVPERFVITKLDQVGDTHGWHWDDYSVAMVWVLRAPPVEAGGVVQGVAGTHWEKSDPKMISQFVNNPIQSYHFASHEAYLMNARTTLHRVYPLIREGAERLILNCAFALREDLLDEISHETVEQLWAN